MISLETGEATRKKRLYSPAPFGVPLNWAVIWPVAPLAPVMYDPICMLPPGVLTPVTVKTAPVMDAVNCVVTVDIELPVVVAATGKLAFSAF